MKEALLGASSGNMDHYHALPQSCKDHEIGELILRGSTQKNARAFNKAAKLMTNNCDQAWLYLDKS